MQLPIKSFGKGLRKDGDSQDMPPEGFREMVNFDIDPSTNEIKVRRPYRAYTKLDPDPAKINNTLPGPTGFYPYWILRYDVGISVVQKNTLIVYREGTFGTTPNWEIWDNAPMGGDGNEFIKIAEETSNVCYPVAVAGKVRIALGNDKDYRIWMPFDWEGTKHEYLFNSGGVGALTDTELRLNVETFQDGITFKNGVVNTWGKTPTKNYLYLDGRLYSQYNIGDFTANASSASVISSTGIQKPLNKGNYSLVVAPVFDEFPTQLGAAIYQQDLFVSKDLYQGPALEYQKLQIGAEYAINKIFPKGWYIRKNYSSGIYELAWGTASPESLGSTASSPIINYRTARYVIEYGGNTLYSWPYSSGNNFIANSGNKLDRIYLEILDTSAGVNATGAHTVVDTIEILKVLNYKSATATYKDVVNKVVDYGDDDDEVFPMYATNQVHNASVLFQRGVFIESTVPTWVWQQMKDQGALLFDILSQRWVPAPGVEWTYTPIEPLVYPVSSVYGDYIRYSLDIPLETLNPRISYFGVFLKASAGNFISETYSLIQKFYLYRSNENTVNTSNAQLSLAAGTPSSVVLSGNITGDNAFSQLGSWEVMAATGDGGVRPVAHKESDITRKMGVMAYRKGRMYAGLLDDDPGQEIIGFTTLADGQDQLDVWFRPLFFTQGSGEANTWITHWQDRLIMFQKNNLFYAALDDKNDRWFNNFAQTGFGTGTHIIKSIAKSRQSLFFINYDGIFRFRGGVPDDITREGIHDYWKYSVSKLQKDLAVGGFNNRTNEYWLAIPGLANDPGTTIYTGSQNDDAFPWEAYLSTPGNWRNYTILIWDDDEYNGQNWRMYQTYNSNGSDDKPVFLFSDRENDWVFADFDKNLYYWEGEENYFANGKDKGTENIDFRLATQHFGARWANIIPNMILIDGEHNPSTDLFVDVNRNGYEDGTQTETYTIKAERRDRKHRLRRRRSDTIQLVVHGSYGSILEPPTDMVKIKEIVLDYLNDSKKPD